MTIEEAKAEIKTSIDELYENGKRHAIFVRNNGELVIEGLRMVLEILNQVEPERKKGKWFANGDIPKDCPFCGEDWDKYVFGDVWYTGELPKFCPNCGADMREDI